MRKHRVSDAFWVALTMATISGFINAYTYNTQGGRFAGAQTGNLIFLGLRLAEFKWLEAWSYCLPILVFGIGQLLIYVMKDWALSAGCPYHLLAIRVMMALLFLAAVSAPMVDSDITILMLALFSSFQVEVFKRIGSIQYANVMMTGNVKAGAYLLSEGFLSGNQVKIKQGMQRCAVLISFILGIILSHYLSAFLEEFGLFLLFPPLLVIHKVIRQEK